MVIKRGSVLMERLLFMDCSPKVLKARLKYIGFFKQ